MDNSQLALVISGVSAALALVSFAWTIGWSIWQHRQLHTPRLTIKAVNALPVGPGSNVGDWCLSITAVNDGGVAVTLTTVKLILKGDPQRRGLFPTQWLQATPKPMPITLTPGQHWVGLTELQDVIYTLRSQFGPREDYDLDVIVLDAADREYKGRFAVSGK